MALPTLNLSFYTHGNASQRQELASRLLDSLSEHGFVKLVGHGISDEQISELFKWNKAFFAIQDQHKLAITHPGGSEPQRGYSGIGAESSAALYRKGLLKAVITEDLRDSREHFDQGAPTDTQFPTRWPPESVLPGFRAFMEELFESFEKIAAQILEALESALSVPSDTFNRLITHEANASELRLNHYPAIDIAELKKGTLSRIWPHFDLGVITLLFQDRNSGLEFEDRRRRGHNEFIGVECDDPREMVVNVSETLQRWTNGRLSAGLHRVGLPSELDGRDHDGVLPERFSVPYFCKADRVATVGCLEPFVEPGAKATYEDMTAIEYHQQRLLSAY